MRGYSVIDRGREITGTIKILKDGGSTTDLQIRLVLGDVSMKEELEMFFVQLFRANGFEVKSLYEQGNFGIHKTGGLFSGKAQNKYYESRSVYIEIRQIKARELFDSRANKVLQFIKEKGMAYSGEINNALFDYPNLALTKNIIDFLERAGKIKSEKIGKYRVCSIKKKEE